MIQCSPNFSLFNQQNIDNGTPLIPLKLLELNLKMWNNFNKPTLEAFKSQYPNWKVIDYYGEEVLNYDESMPDKIEEN